MAEIGCVFAEGFDWVNATSILNGRGSIGSGFSLVTGLQGAGKALRLELSAFATRSCVLTFDQDIDTGESVLHFRFRAGDLPDATHEFIRVRNTSGSTVWNCTISSTGTLAVRRSTTTLLSMANAFVEDVVAHFTIRVKVHASLGEIDIYKDGVLEESVDSVNTQGASGNLRDIELRSGVGSPDGADWDFDDIHMRDDEPRGQIDVKAYPVDEDVSSSGWTPSTGGSLEAVLDETPGTETDYAVSSVDGDTMRFGITPGLGSINPLTQQIIVVARVEESSTSQLELTTHSDAADDGGRIHTALTTSLRGYAGVLNNTDPNTSTPWSPGDLDVAEISIAHNVP